jgi:hypothetical protein
MKRIELLPTFLLGLRTYIKEDFKASAAELFYSRPLSLPAEFFENEYIRADPQRFVEKFRGKHATPAPKINGSSHKTEPVHPQGPLHELPRVLENR